VPHLLDPAKAELQRAFFKRYNAEKPQREQEAAARQQPKTYGPVRLPGESYPDDPPRRDWAKVLTQHGLIPRW
jgi:hypothetical protein